MQNFQLVNNQVCYDITKIVKIIYAAVLSASEQSSLFIGGVGSCHNESVNKTHDSMQQWLATFSLSFTATM